MAGIQHKPVGIFWDIENCSVPKTKSPSDVIAHIRNFFVINRLNHREFEFIISCDVTRLRKDIPEDINKAGGVTLAHVNGSSKNAADEKLRENMKKFVDTHASSVSPVLILISGDIDFVNDLRGYQTRLGCTIVLIHAVNCSPQFKVGWNEIYCFMSFCSAVKDNPALNSAANSKNVAKKQPNSKNPSSTPAIQMNQNELQSDQPKNQGQSNQKNRGAQPNPKNPKNQNGPPDNRIKNNDPKQQRTAPMGNKTDVAQQSGQNYQKPRPSYPINGDQSFPRPPPFPQSHMNGTGNKNRTFNNGPNTGNTGRVTPPDTFPHQPKYNKGNNLSVESAMGNMSTKDATDKPKKLILMVGGLPGKMDFKILKENLQFQANKVHGKVMYVKNGQAFITFNHKTNADRAVELFNGKQVYGKTLNVSFTKAIPFEDQPNGKSKSGPDGMVDKSNTAGGSKQSKDRDGRNNESAPISNSGSLSNDPVLAGLGSIIGGIMANRIAAAKPGNKSPESCPIQ